MGYRESYLKGVMAAKRLHKEIGARENAMDSGGRIDVFSTIHNLDTRLVFQKLEGILGAYLKVDDNTGILVTTLRRLSVQRFTGAHELGHLTLGHAPTLDSEANFGLGPNDLPSVEVEANAFASEFLTPKWLLALHCRRQGWSGAALKDPVNVYQLSLRLGVSYQATCHSLNLNRLITGNTLGKLLSVPPKKIKRMILPDMIEPSDWFGDVWLLSANDTGLFLEGHSDDYFVFRENEASGAGYLWNSDDLKSYGFQFLSENRYSIGGEKEVGGGSLYEITLSDSERNAGEIYLEQVRPWNRESVIDKFCVSFDVHGKEVGMPRAERSMLLSVT